MNIHTQRLANLSYIPLMPSPCLAKTENPPWNISPVLSATLLHLTRLGSPGYSALSAVSSRTFGVGHAAHHPSPHECVHAYVRTYVRTYLLLSLSLRIGFHVFSCSTYASPLTQHGTFPRPRRVAPANFPFPSLPFPPWPASLRPRSDGRPNDGN